MTAFNPYRVLGIRKDSGAKRIKRAFRDRVKQTHPDAGGTAEAFQEVRLAWFVLSDPKRRERYDRTGTIDEQTEISIAARVATCLHELFEVALRNGSAFRTEVDLIEHMRTSAIQSTKELRAQKASLEGMVKQLAKLHGRIVRTDAGDNLFERSLNRRVEELREQMAIVQGRTDVAEATAVELGHYRSVTDMIQHHRVFAWGGGIVNTTA